jgi:hypothetical protein
VLFYTKNEHKLRSELSKAGIELEHKEEIEQYNSYSCDATGSGVKKFANYKYVYLVEGDYNMVEKALSSYSLFWAPYYMDENGNERGFGEQLSVKIRTGTSFSKIKNIAKIFGVEMLGWNRFSTGWYYMACTNHSRANTLEMAAILYNSGLFEEAIPDFIINLHP